MYLHIRAGTAVSFGCFLFIGGVVLAVAPPVCAAEPKLTFRLDEAQLHILIDGKRVATYLFQDDAVHRPHFKNLIAPGGVQVTRQHPPRAGIDATDHADMHPGVWLAFGEMFGADGEVADFWRNKGRVEHVEFVERPRTEGSRLVWTVRNRYRAGERIVCEEVCRHTIELRARGWLLTYDSEFRSDRPFAFGDQEEMGLGVRVATPITVKNGGRMLDSDGRRNEKEVRGQQGKWVDYSGLVDGKRAGVLLMPHPDNSRPSWYHARDYGFIAANAFGRNALTGGEKSRVEIKPGNSLRLRYGVLIYAEDPEGTLNREVEYAAYFGSSKSMRNRHVLYNLDGDSCMSVKKGVLGPTKITPGDLRTIVDEITFPGSQVDTFLLCTNAQVMYYPTQVGTMRGALSTSEQKEEWPAGEKQRFENVQAMFDSGVDPYAVLFEAARKKNLEVLLTFRMNDNHNFDFLHTEFWRDHPEFRLNGGALDFAHEEVREYVFRLIEEAVQRYDVDGLELDFQRFPTFFRDDDKDTEQRIAKINELVKRVRGMLDAEGRKRGKALVLAARVPSDYGRSAPNYELSRSIGCDPVAWANSGWIDFLTISEFLFVRYDLPVKPWKKLITNIPVYGGIECAEGSKIEQSLTAEKYRRAAAHLWKDGADGIYLFNFFTTRENGNDSFEPPFDVLKDLGDRERVAR